MDVKLLKKLLSNPFVSGCGFAFNSKFMDKILKKYKKEKINHTYIYSLGNKNKKKVLISAHLDHIGFIVKSIDDDGFIKILDIGENDVTSILGCTLSIHGKREIVHGIVVTDPNKKNLEGLSINDLVLDCGFKNYYDSLQYIGIGDPIYTKPNFLYLKNKLISCSYLDNRVGVFSVLEVAKNLICNNLDIHFVFTDQEEITGFGIKDAFKKIEPDYLIAIDVTPESSDILVGNGPAISIGAGISRSFTNKIQNIAIKEGSDYQLEVINGETLTDLDAAYPIGKTIKRALISIPCKYTHTPTEICSLKDIDKTTQLLYNIIKELDAK